MVRRKRNAAIIMLKCALIGFSACELQAALGSEMGPPPKLEAGVIKELVGNAVKPQALNAQLPEDGYTPLFSSIILQPDLVASVSQAVGGYILVAQETKNADAPTEPQSVVQETKNADAPTEPQAVMREIRSVARLSGSKQRRRKPKMANVPAGTQAVAQGARESGPQAAQGTMESGPQAAQGNEEIDALDKPLVATQETKKLALPVESGEKKKELKVPAIGKKMYGMAPIRWGASISESLAFKRVSLTSHYTGGSSIPPVNAKTSEVINTQTAEIHGDTYILQPYIAKMKGDFGVNSSKSTTTITGSGLSSITGSRLYNTANTTSVENNTRDNELFGHGALLLFSQSRFPFNMELGVNNTRSNSLSDTQNNTRDYFKIGQSYRSLSSASKYRLDYSQATQAASSDLGTLRGTNTPLGSMHSFWSGSYSTTTPEHGIRATMQLNDKFTSTFVNRTETRRTNDFIVKDAYLPADSLLSLYTFVNINSFMDNVGNSTKYVMGNINGSWQPDDENIPLGVDGSVHLFRQLAMTQLASSTVQSLGGDLGARYSFSKNMVARVDGSAVRMLNNGVQGMAIKERGRVDYNSNVTKLVGNSLYSWSANGGASNSTVTGVVAGDSSPNRGINGGVGHRLTVPLSANMLGRKWDIGSGISQSFDLAKDRLNGQNATIVNSANISLNPVYFFRSKDLEGGRGKTNGVVTTAILTVTDTRVVGSHPLHNRYYNLQLREGNKSTYSQYGIDFEASLGATQGSRGVEITGSGSATYKKARPFDVRGLSYLGRLQITGRSSNMNTEVRDENAKNPWLPWSFDQNLVYRIGQNEVAVRGLVSDEYGVKNASLWLLFRAYRTIGN